MEVKTERQPHGRRNGSAKRLLIGGIPLPLGPGARPDAFAIYEAETATRLTRAGGVLRRRYQMFKIATGNHSDFHMRPATFTSDRRCLAESPNGA